MKILAIDPGTTESAFVVWDGEKILDKGKVKNYDMLLYIKKNPQLFNIMAVEAIKSYGMVMGDSVIETCMWIGRFVQVWHDASARKPNATLLPRKTIVTSLCNSPKANDKNVRQCLIDRFREKMGGNDPIGKKASPGPLYCVTGDIWSALAVAVVAYERETVDILG